MVRGKTMILVDRGASLEERRHLDEQYQPSVWCLARRSPFPAIRSTRSVRAQLQGKGPLPSLRMACASIAVAHKKSCLGFAGAHFFAERSCDAARWNIKPAS